MRLDENAITAASSMKLAEKGYCNCFLDTPICSARSCPLFQGRLEGSLQQGFLHYWMSFKRTGWGVTKASRKFAGEGRRCLLNSDRGGAGVLQETQLKVFECFANDENGCRKQKISEIGSG